MLRTRWTGLGLVATLVAAHAAVIGAQAPSATEIVARSQEAFLAPGADMRARVTMRLVNRTGRERLRDMTLLRLDLTDGDQKYFIYFHSPGDVRDMTFMVWKYAARDDDRWLFVPAIRQVRRLAANDSRSSFVGSDFTYEDVSGRDVAADTHTLLREEPLDGRACYVIESVPKDADVEYQRKVSWIDKQTFLSMKEEYYDRRGELARVYTTEEVRDVGGYPTATRRLMRDIATEHRTEVTFEAVEYDVGLSEDVFSERSLRQPPREWIR
jgi:outer membrane lipoprotein-sorting protein